MLWLALAALWLLGAIGRARLALRFGWTDAALVILIVLHTIAAIWAASRGSPRPAINMLWEWVAFGLSFLLARQLLVGQRETRMLVAAMIALAVALSGDGLYQYLYEMPATRAEYQRNPDKALRDAGLWFEKDTPSRKLFEYRLQSKEPFATFALPNSLAGFLAPWLVVGVGIWVGGLSAMSPLRRRLFRTGAALCLILVAACLLLTKSRSAYLATLLGLILAGLFCRGRAVRIGWKTPLAATGVLAALVAAAIALGGLDREVLSEAGKSLGYRLQYWHATVRMILDYPLLGCGPGHFRDHYTRYKLPEASEEISDPHNFLLEVWATAGTPAMLALVALLVCFAYEVLRDRREQLRPSHAAPDEFVAAAGPDRPVFVIGGMTAGFLLAFPLGWMADAPAGWGIWLVGLPLAALTLALFYPWADTGQLPKSLPAIGLLALLVNLLAAGGIGFPGVAGTLWMLMAVGLNTSAPTQSRLLPQWAGLAGLAATVLLAVGCYVTAYGPVLQSQTALRAAARDPVRAGQLLQSAAMADPLSAEPWIHLSTLTFTQWRATNAQTALDQFDLCMANALELAPRSSPIWLEAGDRYWEVANKTAAPEANRWKTKALTAYRHAVELYPSNAAARAKFAIALDATGDGAGADEEASRALELDRLTPHLDKKLPDELRKRLLRKKSGRN